MYLPESNQRVFFALSGLANVLRTALLSLLDELCSCHGQLASTISYRHGSLQHLAATSAVLMKKPFSEYWSTHVLVLILLLVRVVLTSVFAGVSFSKHRRACRNSHEDPRSCSDARRASCLPTTYASESSRDSLAWRRGAARVAGKATSQGNVLPKFTILLVAELVSWLEIEFPGLSSAFAISSARPFFSTASVCSCTSEQNT